MKVKFAFKYKIIDFITINYKPGKDNSKACVHLVIDRNIKTIKYFNNKSMI